ncbi:ammonia permease [Bacillus cytotoxicus]|uniref:ammonia permease n=1 Tax=Bacillus cereus group sp. BfR-BA-01492 TaxID=2920361 RepID=UPI001F57004F|nr:ammonia permease [Bacillus cereus group sp. BfR-BA-01492]EMA6342710.1 ammonia permease [Bacillus cytotoxicus]
MEASGIFIWIYLTPIFILCGIICGIFFIITGIKYRKLLTILAGLICLSLMVSPFICLGIGIDCEKLLPVSPVVYWSLFPLAGVLAIISGRSIKSISYMGLITFITGFITFIAYQLLIAA